MDLQAKAPTSSLSTSLAAVFSLTLRQLVRGRRLMLFSLVFALPAALALVARLAQPPTPVEQVEHLVLFWFMPGVLIPLICLLSASGMVQDEIEEQTLTYFLIRPIPRTLLYATRLIATFTLSLALVVVFTVAAGVCVWWGSSDLLTAAPQRVGILLLIFVPVVFAYTALFGTMSLYVNRLLAIGIAYVMIFEMFLANMDFVLRKLTVFYHFRVLVLNTIDSSHATRWGITLTGGPLAMVTESLASLLIGGLVLLALGMYRFRSTEYKVKTPGES